MKLLLLVGVLLNLAACDSSQSPPPTWVQHARWVRLDGEQCCPRIGLVCNDGRVVITVEKDFEYHVWGDSGKLSDYFVDWQTAKDASEKYADSNKVCR